MPEGTGFCKHVLADGPHESNLGIYGDLQVNGTWSQQHGAFLLRWEDLPVFLDRSCAPDAGAFTCSVSLSASRSIEPCARVPLGP